MKKFVLVLLLSFMIGNTTVVSAQFNGAPAQNDLTTQEKIAELRALYSLQIESYRQAEHEYLIAKEQYQKLETLKLLEQAVQATKTAMIERNRVLLTYLDLLHISLENTTGVNLTYKEAALENLASEIETLRTYQKSLEATTDRTQLAEKVTEFSELKPEVESVTYRALSLIAIGELQTLHDKSKIILNDLQAAELEASSSALKTAQLERAFEETERNLGKINEQLREQNDYYSRQEGLVKRSFYTRVLESLQPVYVDVSQLLAYLKELLTI